jgi:hypothetical protein
MISHIKYTAVQRQFANMARQKAANLDVLYHGTRHAQSIMKTGALFHTMPGEQKVCLTRSAEVADYWASIKRDHDEGRGSILILDRQSLERRYELVPNPKVWWHSKTLFHDEAEEEIWETVTDVHNHSSERVNGATRWRESVDCCHYVTTRGRRKGQAAAHLLLPPHSDIAPASPLKCSDASAKAAARPLTQV